MNTIQKTEIEKDRASDWNELIEDLIESIRIPSVKADAQEGAPFGIEIDHALRHALECAERMGFRVCYGDGYYGYAEIGEGKEMIGILCHVDVVPAGDQSVWKYPPFDGVHAEGYLWGRGTLDDKGPLFATLYAMKKIAKEHPYLGKRIRLIIGTDEETEWGCIERYLAQEERPTYGFSPDAEFPVVHGEKGLLQVAVKCRGQYSNFQVSGGDAVNAVPERCTYEGASANLIEEILRQKAYPYQREEAKIIVLGKAAHASVNWLGENAISRMCSAVAHADKNPLASFVMEMIDDDPYGKKIFGNFEDPESGSVTINPGLISTREDGIQLMIDIRYPVTKSEGETLERLRGAVKPYGLDLEILNAKAPLYVPMEESIVIKLTEAYEEVCGEKSAPITMGGGTYAKAFDRFVAFGPLFPGEEDTAHCSDERISLKSLDRCAEIYHKALKKLVLSS
jgi:succinyl-diaminopimelate desuccinylase